jgi:hypothetical protein
MPRRGFHLRNFFRGQSFLDIFVTAASAYYASCLPVDLPCCSHIVYLGHLDRCGERSRVLALLFVSARLTVRFTEPSWKLVSGSTTSSIAEVFARAGACHVLSSSGRNFVIAGMQNGAGTPFCSISLIKKSNCQVKTFSLRTGAVSGVQSQ